MQRREIFTAWVLLSAPLIGFVAYLLGYLGLQLGNGNMPLVFALSLAIVCLFFLAWLFISFTDADWRKTTRFIATGLLFEGFVLWMTRTSGREASLYFGIGSAMIGVILLLAAKKH